ncbi:MAG: tetratricopeptide repeat protein [Acidobacteriia bacterium]|nr:tetratricopeptide repeat protein [Terriglobia bacterium]
MAAVAPPRPPQEEDVFSRGVKAYSSGDYATAEKLLSSYLNNNPKSMIRDIGLLWYGRTLIALNRFDDARKIAESMDKEFPKSPLTRKLHDELDTSAKGRKPSPGSVAGAKDKTKPVETKPQPAKQEGASKEPAKKPLPPAGRGPVAEAKKEAPKQPASAEGPKKGASSPAAVKTEKLTPAVAAKVSPALSKPQVVKPPAVTAQAKEKQLPKKAETTAKTQPPTKPVPPMAKKEEKPKTTAMAQVQKPGIPAVTQKTKETKAAAPKEAAKPNEPAVLKPAAKTSAASAAITPKTKPGKPGKTAKASEAKKEGVEKAKPKAEEPEEKGVVFLSRRDPFRPLVVRASDEPPSSLPPGKKGLQVNKLLLKGIVKGMDGYYAVVQSASNPAAIFLREKDVLHDGEVLKIYDDRIIFKHFATDQLGKPFEEEITRRLPSGGVL